MKVYCTLPLLLSFQVSWLDIVQPHRSSSSTTDRGRSSPELLQLRKAEESRVHAPKGAKKPLDRFCSGISLIKSRHPWLGLAGSIALTGGSCHFELWPLDFEPIDQLCLYDPSHGEWQKLAMHANLCIAGILVQASKGRRGIIPDMVLFTSGNKKWGMILFPWLLASSVIIVVKMRIRRLYPELYGRPCCLHSVHGLALIGHVHDHQIF